MSYAPAALGSSETFAGAYSAAWRVPGVTQRSLLARSGYPPPTYLNESELVREVPRPRPLTLIIVAQFAAVPVSILAGFLAMFAATPLFDFAGSGPLPFYTVATVFVLWAPIVHLVLAVGLLVRRAWAWERAQVLGWILAMGEILFVLGAAASLGWVVGLWLTPLVVLDISTLVYLRDPRVEKHLASIT